jgi:hypothetical protein
MLRKALLGVGLILVAAVGSTAAYATENYVVIVVLPRQPAPGVSGGGGGITSLPYDNLKDCQAAAANVPHASGNSEVSAFCVSNQK